MLGGTPQGQIHLQLHSGQDYTVGMEEKMPMHLGIQLSRFALPLTISP